MMRDGRISTSLKEVLVDVIDYRGRTPKKLGGDFSDEGIPVISAKNVKNGSLDFSEGIRYVNPEMYERWMSKKLREGDVLLTSEAPLGQAILLTNELNYCLGQRLYGLRVDSTKLDSRFFYFLLISEPVQRGLQARATGSTAKGIKQSALLEVHIEFPPLPEQRAIAHVLQTIQEAKAARQRELALERERKAALMDYLFSYGTKGEPRKQTEIGEIPESWEVVQIGEIGQVVTGNTPKTSVPEYYGGPYMFIAPGDISEAQYVTKTNKYVSAEGLKVLRPLPCNAVLVVCIGATIGKTAMTSVEPSVTNQQINSIIPNAKAFPHYVYYAVTYRSHRLPSLAGRAAIPIVKKSIFAKFPILLPPLSEQHAIAETLRAFDAKIAALEQEGECIDELFHAMLDELMTGQRSAVTLIDSELLN